MPGVIADHVFHRVGQPSTDVLVDVSLFARPGELTAVLGPHGAGKSSLLHVLAGLDRPAGGRVEVDGIALEALDELELTRLRRDRIGLLLPASSVLPTVTIRENVALPLLIARRPPAPATVDALLARVGLAAQRHARPGELTNAERQRAALARALVAEPSVLLADEPTVDLDPFEEAKIIALLRDVAREDGITVVLFTRSEAAAAVADRTVVLERGRTAPAVAPLAA